MALSDTNVRRARTQDKDYTLSDTDGLALFVRAKGSKYWYFRFSWE
jgi:Arm domain-containing DNA-binding protein